MSRSEADALYARLKARSSSPAEARTLQAVAVVDVLKIDPEFRTASLKFVEFALYNHDFSEKIYDYGAVPAARGDAKKPLADTESKAVPLPEGRFATGPEAEARALQLCMGSTRTATRLKCDCVARKVAAAWENNREKHIYTLLNDAVIAGEYECENPDAMYESYVDNCKRMYASQEFVARLGEEKACKCIAERSMELDPVNALAFCMLVEDYPP